MSREVSEALRRLVGESCVITSASTVWSMNDDVYHGCEVDHILGVKHGGLTVAENLAYACFIANRHKGTDLGSISRRSGTLVRFHNPRTDRWKAHFYWNEKWIESVTDIGEVTHGC